MSDATQEYEDLRRRRDRIMQKRAVIESQEKARAEERTEIWDRLVAAGVDPAKPDKEIERLQLEIDTDREKLESAFSEIEAMMDGKAPAKAPETREEAPPQDQPAPTPEPEKPTPAPTLASPIVDTGSDNDIDI